MWSENRVKFDVNKYNNNENRIALYHCSSCNRQHIRIKS